MGDYISSHYHNRRYFQQKNHQYISTTLYKNHLFINRNDKNGIKSYWYRWWTLWWSNEYSFTTLLQVLPISSTLPSLPSTSSVLPFSPTSSSPYTPSSSVFLILSIIIFLISNETTIATTTTMPTFKTRTSATSIVNKKFYGNLVTTISPPIFAAALVASTTIRSVAAATAVTTSNSSTSSLLLKIVSNNDSNNITSTLSTYSLISNTTATANSTITCEPKVLDEIPPDPFYDVTDITLDAAKTFAEFLSRKTTSDLNAIRKHADSIAKIALKEDENLLAVALAAPAIQIAVVKFRNQVDNSNDVHNKTFLSTYWRELGIAWNHSDGTQLWGAPFRDCGPLKGRWLWPFSVSITEYGYKVVASSFIAADTDQCNDALEEIFGRKHSCDRETTFCLLTESNASSPRGSYTCICKESYYIPNQTLQGFLGEKIENSNNDSENFSCVPCPGGCSHCDQTGECLFGEPQEIISMETLLRATICTILGACMLCCVMLLVIVFRQRKCKAIACGMWTVLWTILFGILLLYASVALHFFPASTTRCLLEPWLRELGFVICYGAIILKLYRHLVEFRTRKAHRSVLRDIDLLKYLGTMTFAVICYMSAFTASSIDLIETANIDGLQEISTNTCHPLKWEYVTQISEILILCFGMNLAIASRNANTQFRERQFLVASILIEFIVSSSFYILRAIYLPELSPGAIFLALFVRSQLTNTVTVGLLFLPKLWYQHKQVRSCTYDLSLRLPVDAFKGSHDIGHHLGGGYAGLCLGDPDIGELTISEMSPEDIRAELKRLYTQLEILKNKTIRQDNPHISKRRGGRKAHRRFSLQALSSKHKTNKHHDLETTEAEPSRTPEDSVCSAEGPTDTYAEISGVSHSTK